MRNRISWGVWAIRCMAVAGCCVRGVLAGDGQSQERQRPACQIEQFRFEGEKLLDLYIEPIASRFFGSGDEFQIVIYLADNTLLVSHCQVLWQNLAH